MLKKIGAWLGILGWGCYVLMVVVAILGLGGAWMYPFAIIGTAWIGLAWLLGYLD